MARKRVTRGSHKPDPQYDNNVGGYVDVVSVTEEGDGVNLNVQVTLFASPTNFVLHVYCSVDDGPFLLLYRTGPPTIDDLTPCAPPAYPVGYFDWYYEERSPSGELLARNNVTRIVV